MGFLKLGEHLSIDKIETFNVDSPIIDDEVVSDFKKTAQHLKKIAPKAKDFLYFVATIIHAAEASAYNEDGSPKLTKSGEPVSVKWDNDWRWVSNDPSIQPYRNANHDIFPESALLEVVAGEDIPAYKKWVGKPLCIDHKSSSVDHVRGFIVDTFYDDARKRVVALCALDKVNFPDLARKVSTGYSSNVSMGTGVSTAVCTDCLRKAKTEADFCNHMRTKSSYGEINLGLNPIELSIVVTPADPKAKIKHVIASMQSYINMRENQIKQASDQFSFSIAKATKDSDDASSLTFNGSFSSLDELESEITDSIAKLKESMHNEEFDEKDSQSSDSDETQTFEVSQISPPVARFADDSEIKELMKAFASLENQFNKLKDQVNQTTSNKEKEMSGKLQNRTAYFQGGGGVNEPTPGKTKYAPESDNEDLRSEDKHMKVEPNSMGGQDGMHPGVKSVPMSELDRKKMLARAEYEERAMRRAAALETAKASLEKSSYFQGGGDVNEPSPGKRKYDVDPAEGKARKEDKHMTGQKPFPGVGDVDGLHPSPESVDEKDELKRKQKLSRAGYRAVFTKKASQGESVWKILSDDKVIYSATVDELSGGKTDLLYTAIATQDFGSKLLKKVKVAGVEGVKSLFKKAQDAQLPEAAPAAPAAEMPEETSGTMGAADMDMGGDGDPKDQLRTTLEKLQELTSDAVEAFRALSDEKAEMGEAPMAASASTKMQFRLRKEVHDELFNSFRQVIAELRDYQGELQALAERHENKSMLKQAQKEVLADTTKNALADARSSIADGMEVMAAFVNYIRATQAMLKQASELEEVKNEYQASDDLMSMLSDDMGADDSDPMLAADDMADLDKDIAEVDAMLADSDDSYEVSSSDDVDDADDMDATFLQTSDGSKVELKDGAKVVSAGFDLTTAEGRKAYRTKLAAEAVQPLHPDAHESYTMDLDYKTDLAHVETIEEQHEAMLDSLSKKAKVKKEAEKLHQFVSEGSIKEEDFDYLVSQGLDKDAVDYYKKYFSQADGGSEFSSELIKEHVKAEAQRDLEIHKAKMQRAYVLANKMASRGMCLKTEAAIANQVDELMKFNDDQFDSLSKIVDTQAVKQATFVPQVGLSDSMEVTASAQPYNLQAALESILLNPSKRRGF